MTKKILVTVGHVQKYIYEGVNQKKSFTPTAKTMIFEQIIPWAAVFTITGVTYDGHLHGILSCGPCELDGAVINLCRGDREQALTHPNRELVPEGIAITATWEIIKSGHNQYLSFA